MAKNLATGVERSTQTDAFGAFAFAAIPPGAYSLAGSHKFKEIQVIVRVFVGNVTVQDISLPRGVGKTTVDVTGKADLLRPAESSIESVLQRSPILHFPLNGRRYTDVTQLTPNTSTDGDTGLFSIAGQQGGEDSGYANANGATVFTVDGTHATSNYFADILGRYRARRQTRKELPPSSDAPWPCQAIS